MRPELSIPLAFLVAALATWAATPLAIQVARRTGFMDKPAGYKGHGNPTPYLGGSAIMAGVLAGAVALRGGAGGYAGPVAGGVGVWGGGPAGRRLDPSPPPRAPPR